MFGEEAKGFRHSISPELVESSLPEFAIDFVTVSAQFVVIKLGIHYFFRIENVAKRQASRACILNDLRFAIGGGSPEFRPKERTDSGFDKFRSGELIGLQSE